VARTKADVDNMLAGVRRFFSWGKILGPRKKYLRGPIQREIKKKVGKLFARIILGDPEVIILD